MIPYHRPIKMRTNWMDYKIAEVLDSGNLTNGEYVRALEYWIETKYNCTCYACSSGTQGLLLAMFILNNSQRVSIPAFNWFSDKYFLELLNKEIVYRDIERDTWLTDGIATSLRLHTFGNSDPYESNVIYDGTHALGTKFKELGKATVISLAPTKLITACEGGLILLKEPNEKIREYRDKCSRMSEIHAIVGIHTLHHLDKILSWKKKLYDYYKKNLDGKFQEIPYHSNYNTIGMLTDLKIPEEIETKKYYKPLKKGLVNTDYVYSKMICLPSWYGVDYKRVVELIEEANP